MKKLNAFFLSILLLTFSATMNPLEESFAISLIEEEATLKKELAENAISDALEIVADEKSVKKIENAQKQLEKGNTDFDNEKFKKAIKHYDKALKKIQKALKEPHAKKMRIVDKGSLDLSQDGIDDIYLKMVYPKNPNKPIKVDVKIKDSCVDGVIHDNAEMKIGFSTGKYLEKNNLVSEGFEITNDWFKKNDPDKQINPVTEFSSYFSIPEDGDYMIQKNSHKKGSFVYKTGIKEIGNQDGWKGTFEFKGNQGEYKMNLFLPITTPTSEGDDCNLVFAVGIHPINIS